MKNRYFEPEFKVINVNTKDIVTTSGDDFNMQGDKVNAPYFNNTNWIIGA